LDQLILQPTLTGNNYKITVLIYDCNSIEESSNDEVIFHIKELPTFDVGDDIVCNIAILPYGTYEFAFLELYSAYYCNTNLRDFIDFTYKFKYNGEVNTYLSNEGTYGIINTDSSNYSLELLIDGLIYRDEAFNNTIQSYELYITPHYKNYEMVNTSIKYVINEKPPITFVSDVSEIVYLTGYSELNNEIVYTCNYYDKFVFEPLIYDCNIKFNVTNTLNNISSTWRVENAYSNNAENCNIELFGDYRNTTYSIYIDAYYEGYEGYKIRFCNIVVESNIENVLTVKDSIINNVRSYEIIDLSEFYSNSYPFFDDIRYSIPDYDEGIDYILKGKDLTIYREIREFAYVNSTIRIIASDCNVELGSRIETCNNELSLVLDRLDEITIKDECNGINLGYLYDNETFTSVLSNYFTYDIDMKDQIIFELVQSDAGIQIIDNSNLQITARNRPFNSNYDIQIKAYYSNYETETTIDTLSVHYNEVGLLKYIEPQNITQMYSKTYTYDLFAEFWDNIPDSYKNLIEFESNVNIKADSSLIVSLENSELTFTIDTENINKAYSNIQNIDVTIYYTADKIGSSNHLIFNITEIKPIHTDITTIQNLSLDSTSFIKNMDTIFESYNTDALIYSFVYSNDVIPRVHYYNDCNSVYLLDNSNLEIMPNYRNTNYTIIITASNIDHSEYTKNIKYSVTEGYLEPPEFKNNVTTNYVSYKDSFTINVESLLNNIYPYVDKLKYSINGVESIQLTHIYDNVVPYNVYTVITSNIEFNHSNTIVLNVLNYVIENEEDTEPLVWK